MINESFIIIITIPHIEIVEILQKMCVHIIDCI